MFQDSEKGAIFHRGTAYLAKRDKAFILPRHTIMRSPNGVRLSVTRVKALDVYQLRIFGQVLEEQDDGVDVSLDERKIIMTTGFVWPCLEWTVEEVPGFDPCGEITYVGQKVPAPLRSVVKNDATADSLLYERPDFPADGVPNTRILPAEEYHQLMIRMGHLRELHSFTKDLKKAHDFEDELILQQQEEDEEAEASDEAAALAGTCTNDAPNVVDARYINLPQD